MAFLNDDEMTFQKYIYSWFTGLKSLATGLKVTIREFFRPKVTERYPENRATLVMFDRFRGELVMPHDENNQHACTACGICMMNCPNGTIHVISKTETTEDGKTKKVLDRHEYDLGQCTFCNLCVLSCPSQAIRFSTRFENAVYTRSILVRQLNREGSSLRAKNEGRESKTSDVSK